MVVNELRISTGQEIKTQKMSELEMSVLIMPEKMLFFGEIYTTDSDRNSTLPPLTNSLSNPAFKTVVEND